MNFSNDFLRLFLYPVLNDKQCYYREGVYFLVCNFIYRNFHNCDLPVANGGDTRENRRIWGEPPPKAKSFYTPRIPGQWREKRRVNCKTLVHAVIGTDL